MTKVTRVTKVNQVKMVKMVKTVSMVQPLLLVAMVTGGLVMLIPAFALVVKMVKTALVLFPRLLIQKENLLLHSLMEQCKTLAN